MTEQQVPTSEGLGEADAMGAIFDKLTAEPVTEDAPAPAEQPEAEAQPETAEKAEDQAAPEPEKAAEPEPEAKPEPVAVPSELPAPIKAQWQAMTPEARDAVMQAHREMANRLAETGRVAAAARPVYDVIVQAARELPVLQDMRPQEIAQEVFHLARTAEELKRDPVGTLLRVAKERGALEGVRQALSGQQPTDTTPALVAEIRSLKAQLAQVADPSALEQRVMQTMTARETERAVTEYASTAEHWPAVEALMPQYVQIAQTRLGEGASVKDVLDAAYDMAIHADPTLRAKVTAPAPKPQPQPDPARTAAQLAARSVNVASKSSSNPRPMTERQRLESVWDRFAQS